ncbi:dTDP-4-keto-6-deoxy-D-glucose epimerase [Komagataeibacter medellinensis]|uniref:dTDP-4-dehydrorhamnose 3,5-epimerase n=1 Tax=Komagataeibacter medellinensis TaxID=1177712 RepID=A0ABQ6W058_9PROT|nr:dTDP-4-keto-6-deoxy-D-glucose epimerase [Komagataeibacter medellinensis]
MNACLSVMARTRLFGADMPEHGPLSSLFPPVAPSVSAEDGVVFRPLPIEGPLLLAPAARNKQVSRRAACAALVHEGIALSEHFMRSDRTERYDRHVVRGLYCQVPPHAQGRLMQCSQGAVWVVGVDVRTGSPSFGQWAGVTLSAENACQFWLPPGFLHGLCSLADDTEVRHRGTRPETAVCARTIRWNDETLGIEWPVRDHQAILLQPDDHASSFANVIDWFLYG